MKRLCLLRHAKSDWADKAQHDAQRPLNKRGQKAAAFMAGFMVARGFQPDAVLCSTAKRAVATVAPLAEQCPDLPVIYRDALYMAMPEKLLEQVATLPADAGTGLIVAHNPGLSLFALHLLADPEGPEGQDLTEGFTTGALAVLDFDVASWTEVTLGLGHLVFFGRPRQLMAAP